MLFRIITLLFIGGILFRVFFRFILPVFRITSVTGSRIRQMQQQMNEMQQRANADNTAAPRKRRPQEGDYIDYEEVN